MCGDDDLDEFPCWHWWTGVSGLYYARRLKSSPPIVFRGESLGALRELVQEYIAGRHSARTGGPASYALEGPQRRLGDGLLSLGP